MAELIPLGEPWESRGWRLKIRDREIREPPHATLFGLGRQWRWELRRQQFMDRDPDPRDVPGEVVEALRMLHPVLVQTWDAMYPANPVFGAE
jgi:hypothetical protein